MSELPRPPPVFHAATLSSLTDEPVVAPPRLTYSAFPSQKSTASRQSTARRRPGMNRTSTLLFADFNNFESPRNSRHRPQSTSSNEEAWMDSPPSSPTSSIDSTQTSTYILEKNLPEPPYHVFSREKKKQMVYIVSLAGLFSPLSSNIYFPALGQIANDVHVSLSLISLTITVYMIVQGLAPSFWGPLSDTKGRRITFIGTFVVYLIANVGLAFSNSFTSLMIFRALQAAGSAATISVGAGVIGDITTAKERGSLIGIFGGIRMMGQSIGPVFGGLISQYLGFHAIFWFLFALGTLALSLIIFFLPETLRSIAGNGTIKLNSVHKPLSYTLFGSPPEAIHPRSTGPKKKITLSSIVSPLKFLFEKDVFITLFFGAIIYTIWSMVTSSTTALFQTRFGLNQIQTGLIFLPNGAGCVLGSYLTGYLMDRDYKIVEREYREEHGIEEDIKLDKKSMLDFPIEKCRLRNIWWHILIFILTTSLYGFSISLNILALPLILQFFIAYTATAVFSMNSALVIDLYPGASASATAVNNLMRCSLGAGGVAVVQIIIDGIGAGYAFLAFAGVVGCLSPGLVVVWVKGGEWRGERRERLRVKEERRARSDLEGLVKK